MRAATIALFISGFASQLVASDPTSNCSIRWLDDYATAYHQAKDANKLLLVWFFDPQQSDRDSLAAKWTTPEVLQNIPRFVPVGVPTTQSIEFDGESRVLIEQPEYSELHGRPGLAIVDLTDASSPHFRSVVSVYPFTDKALISAKELAVLLSLPPGSLTQRTLIFAVRTHPESPQSTSGELLPLLAKETERHSTHQATITLQGHHNWESRFYKLNDQLADQMIAREVCAESWPGQPLLDAARECVHSWRQSPGHWNAVRNAHRVFGYDMKRGSNGVWYATGLFADPHGS